ncbi:response regulator transcription factor [Xylophilus sp.]|uniref:response regulator transcription factor n=1 Tax=Xylophilus sp. TaxID=2653893 RepID=UPI0013BDF751|nr:response regulator transcription factor [Xylophilus sp.]KAF1045448.1 MAG: Transcriptional regulatory protein tctD [Xylophilus sp.]
MNILLVEDDPAMQTALRRALGSRGMDVDTAADGHAALAQWTAQPPDAVVLDLSLPGLDGLEVLTQARRQGLRTPVIVLTARSTVGDRVLGLNTGADDYLAKPFDLDELEARLHALLRRGGAGAQEVVVGPLRHDRSSGAIYNGARLLDLTPREAALLQALMEQAGRAVSKERLFELVFPDGPQVQYEAVEVVVYRLRKKLAGTGVTLVTLRGLGSLLKADPA